MLIVYKRYEFTCKQSAGLDLFFIGGSRNRKAAGLLSMLCSGQVHAFSGPWSNRVLALPIRVSFAFTRSNVQVRKCQLLLKIPNPNGPFFKARLLISEYGCGSRRHVFRGALCEPSPTAPLFETVTPLAVEYSSLEKRSRGCGVICSMRCVRSS